MRHSLIQLVIVDAKLIRGLHISCFKGTLDMTNFILDWGVSVNQSPGQEKKYAHMACLNGQTETVLFILKMGANIYVKTIDGDTPMHFAVYNKH